jgi:hypothetical protein
VNVQAKVGPASVLIERVRQQHRSLGLAIGRGYRDTTETLLTPLLNVSGSHTSTDRLVIALVVMIQQADRNSRSDAGTLVPPKEPRST